MSKEWKELSKTSEKILGPFFFVDRLLMEYVTIFAALVEKKSYSK